MKPISAKIIARPTARLLSIESCRQQCEIVPLDTDSDGVSTHPDDTLLLALQDAAVGHAEKFTGRSILIRTYEFALDKFPRRAVRGSWRDGHGSLVTDIEVPYPPLIEVISFTYTDDSDGVLEQGVDFLVDDYEDKARLRPLSSWPGIATPASNGIKFRYRAGYSSEVDPDSDAEPLPGEIRAAILLTLSHLYENRSASTEKAMAELPLGVEALLRPLRVLTGMA